MPATRAFALLTSLVLLLGLLLSAAGCGGSSSGSSVNLKSPGSAPQLTRRQGSLSLSIAWPERGRLIPEAANSLVMEITAPDHPSEGVIRREVLTRPAEGGVVNVTFNEMPEVRLRLAVHTAPEANGSGVPLSTGIGEVVLTPNDRVKTVSISLDSTITEVIAVPDSLSVGIGESKVIEVQATDADGNIVVTSPNKWEWTAEGPITVDATGLRATVTGTAGGNGSVLVRETESGASTPVPVRVTTPEEVPEVGVISGIVYSAETGLPLEGVRVETASLDGLHSATTNAQGRYRLIRVPPGSRVLSFALCGYRTAFGITVSLATTDEVTVNAALQPTTTRFEAPPFVELNEPQVTQANGTARLTGTITGIDTGQAVLLVNGFESLITVEPNGSFDHIAILSPGTNRLQVRAVNCQASTLSPVREVQLAADYLFRVTLEWDGSGDVDLYTWAPNGQLSYYGNPVIDAGELDVDNVEANGPENFTYRVALPGRYAIGVNAYARAAGRQATIKVAIYSGPNSGRVYFYGPYTFTENSFGSGPVGNTPSWWRPLDIVVTETGTIFVDEPAAQVNRSRSQALPKR